MTITLGTVPGFSDLQNSVLAATKPSIGAHLQRINSNANFGMVRLEVFTAVYKHGDVVPVPVSAVDGYTYSRNELNYMWVPQSTANQATGWASYREPWTMWYGIWNVDQTTGTVTSEIGYRGNNDHQERQATTNDGVVQVFVIAQRQKANLIVSAQPTYTKKLAADFYVNEAMHTGLLTALNADAKFSVINTEVIYMGEFAHGATVPQPVSPADGRTYAYTEVKFQTCWRWTSDTDGSGNPQKPALNKGQLQDWNASVTAGGGVMTEAVVYELSGQHTYNIGKVAVFAFCQRPLGTTFAAQQTGFNEILDSVFAPGQSLRVTTMQQLNDNINQAVCTPEFFGPTNYANGATIPLPVSPLDGYTYLRSELSYIWDWANTGPSANATGRLSVVHGSISATGVVTINDYRLNSGAAAVSLAHEGAMRVTILAKRASNFGTPPAFTNRPPTFGVDDVIEFFGPNDRQTQYLSKGDGSVTVSSLLNGQGSILPNQVISLTFSMPAPGTILNVSWANQSLLRPDGSFLNLVSSTNTIGANVVVDGDGESATVGSQAASWAFGAGNGLLGANDFVFSGTKALKIINGTAANSFSSQTISGLVDGKQYSLRCMVKTTALVLGGAGPGGAFLHIAPLSGVSAVTFISSASGFVIPGSGADMCIGLAADGVTVWPYTFVEATFRCTGSGSITLYAQLGFNVAGVSGTCWFDEIALVPVGITYTGLSNSTHYYLYPYIETATGLLKMANGTPPGSSPSDTFAAQQLLDFRVQVAPKNILTPAAGASGSDTGGGSGTCPEWEEPVTIRRYSNEGELVFEGKITAKEVCVGFESDDGLMRRGDLIRGWSFAKNAYVWRAVQKKIIVPCSGWSLVKGRLLTPCEAVWWEDRWMAAWKTPGANHVKKVSFKVLIEVEADWDDEHNYVVGEDLIIHNMIVLPC